MVRICRSEAQTRELGRRLGRLLRGRDVVCLHGELGSGKTTFTQGLCAALGCRQSASSPTFVLAKRYRGRRWTVHHLDLYRVAGDVTGDIGIEELLEDPRGVVIVEWPQAGLAYYPADRLELSFKHGRNSLQRRVAVRASGPRSRDILKKLA